MRKHKLVVAGATLLAASLALSACGSRTETGGGAGEAAATKTAKIGVIAPLSGDLSALGLGIQHSVDLAVKQANDSNAIPGWKLEVDAEDDEAKPDVGKNAATKLAGDDDVIGVVGTLNSSVAQQVQPVLRSAQTSSRSPRPTPDPSLTQGAGPRRTRSAPTRRYFRTCTTDAVQGPFAAQYLLRDRASRRSRRSTTRRPTARVWSTPSPRSSRSSAAGSSRPRRSTPTTRTTTRSSPRSSRRARRPSTTAASTRRPVRCQQMKAAGLNVPLMGGDGIYDPNYIELAGKTPTVTWPPRSARRPRAGLGASSSSTTTRRPATRSRTRPTAATPTTRPTRSSTR